MQTEHSANFGAFFLGTFATGKTFQQYRSLGLRFGQLPAGSLDTKLVEEFDEDFKVLVHSIC